MDLLNQIIITVVCSVLTGLLTGLFVHYTAVVKLRSELNVLKEEVRDLKTNLQEFINMFIKTPFN